MEHFDRTHRGVGASLYWGVLLYQTQRSALRAKRERDVPV